MIRLREAVEADLRSLFELDQICFPPEIAYSLDDFQELLHSKKVIRVVAEIDSSLAGFAIAQFARGLSHACRIITIDVAPSFRRRGVGRSLIQHLEISLRDTGAKWLRLEVAADNLRAHEFYANLGFEATGLISGYYGGSLDAVVMEKPLGGDR